MEEGESTSGDGSPDVEEQGASTGGDGWGCICWRPMWRRESLPVEMEALMWRSE